MTVVVVDDVEHRRDSVMVARLARLAAVDELVVVCGSDWHRPGHTADAVMTGLRDRLPRHRVVAMRVEPHAKALERGAAVVNEFLEIGDLPVVVTPAAFTREVAARLASLLRADRVLTVSRTKSGVRLRETWSIGLRYHPSCLAR
jgi:hypothetical protein